MKKRSAIVIAIVLIVLIVTSYFVGSYVTEQKNSKARIERCKTLITFAIDKATNGDLSDQGTMRGLISNVYAAYLFCDDSKSANQLHDLWNYLILKVAATLIVPKKLQCRNYSPYCVQLKLLIN